MVVRAGMLHREQPTPSAQWSRKAASLLVLLATLAALTLVLEAQQYGRPLAEGPVTQAVAAVEPQPAVVPVAERQPVRPPAVDESGYYRAVSDFVARRYRVSRDVAFDFVSHAYRVGRELQLDPLLIIAVMAIESSFNPIAESVAGAKGLMQIIPRYHVEKFEPFGGPQAVFDPATNIRVGAQILKEYIRYTGNIGIALQMYAGALNDAEDHYTQKVLGMKQRLQYVVARSRQAEKAKPVVRTASARSGTLPVD